MEWQKYEILTEMDSLIVVTTNITVPKQKSQQSIVIKEGFIFNFLLHYNESRFVRWTNL